MKIVPSITSAILYVLMIGRILAVFGGSQGSAPSWVGSMRGSPPELPRGGIKALCLGAAPAGGQICPG
jgi:hypothetical protein